MLTPDAFTRMAIVAANQLPDEAKESPELQDFSLEKSS